MCTRCSSRLSSSVFLLIFHLDTYDIWNVPQTMLRNFPIGIFLSSVGDLPDLLIAFFMIRGNRTLDRRSCMRLEMVKLQACAHSMKSSTRQVDRGQIYNSNDTRDPRPLPWDDLSIRITGFVTITGCT